MFENKFDQVIDEISTVHGLNWNDDSKVRLFARFLAERPNLLVEWEKFLEEEAADEELVDESVEDETSGRCFPVEWDEQYTGGEYSSAGDIDYVPFALLDNIGDADEQVGRAFEKHTGVHPIHIVWYTFDEVYDEEGERIEE